MRKRSDKSRRLSRGLNAKLFARAARRGGEEERRIEGSEDEALNPRIFILPVKGVLLIGVRESKGDGERGAAR